jgi:phage gp45-like
VNLRDLEKVLGPLRRRVQLLVSRGVLHLSYEDKGMRLLNVTLLANEPRDGVEHLEQYGFTSRGLPDAEVFALAHGGDRAHCLVFCVADRRYRLQSLQLGEVAIYDDEGTSIVLRRGGRVEVHAPGGVDLQGDLRVEGSVVATGDVSDARGSVQAFRDVYDQHTHPETGSQTGPPVPQSDGGGNLTASGETAYPPELGFSK